MVLGPKQSSFPWKSLSSGNSWDTGVLPRNLGAMCEIWPCVHMGCLEYQREIPFHLSVCLVRGHGTNICTIFSGLSVLSMNRTGRKHDEEAQEEMWSFGPIQNLAFFFLFAHPVQIKYKPCRNVGAGASEAQGSVRA